MPAPYMGLQIDAFCTMPKATTPTTHTLGPQFVGWKPLDLKPYFEKEHY